MLRVLAILVFLVPRPAMAEDVLVFAAASLGGVLDPIAAAWGAETGHSVTLTYGGSSVLARQVAAGAPADLVFLANSDWMDHLTELGAVQEDTRADLLTNRLVLIGGAEEPDLPLHELPAAIGDDRLALALTQAVPAGIYARAALNHLGMWEVVADRIVEADNVRAALHFVQVGAARFGIVYGTDVTQSAHVRVIAEIPPEAHPAIRYPAALTPAAAPVAGDFLAHLASPQAAVQFEAAGFVRLTP